MTRQEKLDLLALLKEDTATPEAGRPRFELLGPLGMRHGDRDVAPSAPKLRVILATLLFNANKTVSADTLARELWGEEPPRTAHATVQTYMFKLRRLFVDVLGTSVEHVAREVLPMDSGGYLLRVDPEQLDVTEFDRLVSSGTAAMHVGDYGRAAADLHAALALWRGDIVHHGQLGTRLRAQVARLAERRWYALTSRIDVDLCLGRHRETISELASVVVEQPLHEQGHAMLMVALYRAGRVPAALDVYRQFRGRLRNELGIEPSERIQALHLAVLSHDPALADRELTSDLLLDHLARTAILRRRGTPAAVSAG